MKYEIGEYGLTRNKIACWASKDGTPIQYLWFVDKSVEGGFATYEEAVERIKEKMRSDKESGRMDDCLKEQDGHIIIYFTAGWNDGNPATCTIKMHISNAYDEKILNLVREYDDRIVVENI